MSDTLFEIMKGKSQKERVMMYMEAVGPITHREAFIELGIVDLPKRISELINDDGVKIHKEKVKGHNRFGEKTDFVRYSLEDEAA